MITHHTIITSLNIGSRHITATILDVNTQGEIQVIGHGCSQSAGMDKGRIMHVDQLSQAIIDCVEQAEAAAEIDVSSLLVGIAGHTTRLGRNNGGIPIGTSARKLRKTAITRQDVKKVLANAGAVPFSTDMEILHVLPAQYKVDGRNGIKDPVRLTGTRLEAEVMVVAVDKEKLDTIGHAIRNAQFKTEGFVFNPLATAYSVTTEEERDLGVCVVDIGSEYTEIAVFHHGNLQKATVIHLGGDSVTGDIAHAFSISLSRAEEIKKQYGLCVPMYPRQDKVPSDPQGDHEDRSTITVDDLVQVIMPRMLDILEEVHILLYEAGGEEPAHGLVFTGGASRMKGLVHLAKKMFSVPVRIGEYNTLPKYDPIQGQSEYSSALGLGVYGMEQKKIRKKDVLDNRFFRLCDRYLGWLKQIM